MRHPPAFQIDVRMGRAWVWGLIILVTLSISSALAWAVLLWQHQSVLWPLFTVGLLALVAIYFEFRRHKAEPPSLRWDGQQWLFAAKSNPGTDMRPGEVRIMLDFGEWLLLRFTEASQHSIGRKHRYLALSRVDLVHQWNVLRSTLYSTAAPASLAAGDTAPH